MRLWCCCLTGCSLHHSPSNVQYLCASYEHKNFLPNRHQQPMAAICCKRYEVALKRGGRRRLQVTVISKHSTGLWQHVLWGRHAGEASGPAHLHRCFHLWLIRPAQVEGGQREAAITWCCQTNSNCWPVRQGEVNQIWRLLGPLTTLTNKHLVHVVF